MASSDGSTQADVSAPILDHQQVQIPNPDAENSISANSQYFMLEYLVWYTNFEQF